MKKIMAVAALIAIISQAEAVNYGDVTVSQVTSIYDGDTFKVVIKGWPAVAGERMPVRARGFDAPELKGKCQEEINAARAAKKITVEALRTAKTIDLRNISRGKYFRIIADVYVDGKPLKEIHFGAGTARPYNGGQRYDWCRDEDGL